MGRRAAICIHWKTLIQIRAEQGNPWRHDIHTTRGILRTSRDHVWLVLGGQGRRSVPELAGFQRGASEGSRAKKGRLRLCQCQRLPWAPRAITDPGIDSGPTSTRDLLVRVADNRFSDLPCTNCIPNMALRTAASQELSREGSVFVQRQIFCMQQSKSFGT